MSEHDGKGVLTFVRPDVGAFVEPRCRGAPLGPALLLPEHLAGGLEPRLNAREVVLLDVPILEQQLLGLVWRGSKVDHPSGEHDDFANAAAGVVELVTELARDPLMLW